MPDISFLLIVGGAAFLGAVVQSSVGLGLGLLCAPVVAFVDPTLMPGSLLIAALALPLLTIGTEWRHIDPRGLIWGLPARLPGSVVGAWLVGALEPRMLGALVGVMVLLAAAASRWAPALPLTPVSLVTAGLVSGVTGTATSIGGPPIALLYQHQPAPVVRGTLAGYFLFGGVVSLAILGAYGELGSDQVGAGLALIPFAVLGFLAGGPLRARIGVSTIRTTLLCVVACSGVALIAKALL